MPADKTSGSSVSNTDGFDFHETQWKNNGDDDKGSRTSHEWHSSGGGWNKGEGHNTDQNVEKGKEGRHPK